MDIRANKIKSFLLVGLMLFLALTSGFAYAADDASTAVAGITPQSMTDYLSDRGIDIKKTNSTVENDYRCYKGADVTEEGEAKERYYCIKLIKGSKMYDRIVDKDGKETYGELYSSIDETGAGCPIVSVKWHYNKKCAFCRFLKVAYRAGDHVTNEAFSNFSNSFANLIVIVFVIWLAIRTLNHAAFLTPQDAAKYITDILIQAFKFLLAYYALKNYEVIFHDLLEPIFKSGLDFANGFVESGITDTETPEKLQLELYSNGLYEYMEKFSYNVNHNFSLLQTVGSVLNCLGFKFLSLKFILEGEVNLGLGLNCIIYGLFFSIIGFLLSIAFIFYLFDAVVEYGIFGAIIPFALACWPFKMFTKSANNAMKMFMNSVFTFMMAGVAVRISVELIAHAIGASTGGSLADLVQAMDVIDVDKLKRLVTVISLDFLVFAFACLSGFLLVGKIQALTNTFASGGMSPTASKIATMAASSVKGTAQKVTKPMAKAAENKVRSVGHNIVHNNPIAKGLRKLKANSQEKKQGNPNAQTINIEGGGNKIADSGNENAGINPQPNDSSGAASDSGGDSSTVEINKGAE